MSQKVFDYAETILHLEVNLYNEIEININNLNISLVSNSVNITKQSIINGTTLGFLPKSSITSELENEMLKIININSEKTDLLNCNYSLIKRNDYQLNQHEQNFYDFMLSI